MGLVDTLGRFASRNQQRGEKDKGIEKDKTNPSGVSHPGVGEGRRRKPVERGISVGPLGASCVNDTDFQ